MADNFESNVKYVAYKEVVKRKALEFITPIKRR